MNDKEFNKITSKFKDVKPIIAERKSIVYNLNRIRRRLKTKQTKYDFLKDIVGLESASDILVDAIVRLLKDLQLGTIENVDRKYKEEDIRITSKGKLFIIEVTGTPKPIPEEPKIHQISKHINNRQKQHNDKKVIGVFIVNHDYNKHYKKRDKEPFSERIVGIAKSNNYTVMTTIDLLEDYKRIRTGNIEASEILEKMSCAGRY